MQEFGSFVVALALIGVFSAPLYLVLAVPGLAACLVAKRHLRGPFWARASAMSAIIGGLLTPVLVPGHSPLILPFPFGLWLSLHMRNAAAARVALYCLGGALAVLGLLSWRYWNRERAGLLAQGRIEPLWRGRSRG